MRHVRIGDGPTFTFYASWRPFLTRFALFSIFWVLYLYLGLSLSATTVFNYMDVLFDADVERVIYDLTAPRANHGDTAVHPLFVLLFNPIGAVLAKALGSNVTAAVCLTSFTGALCVVLAYEFFIRAGVGAFNAVVYAAILGFSSAHIFFGSVPETWIFAAFAVILTFTVALIYRGSTKLLIPAGVFSFAITVSNIFQGVIVYAANLWKTKSLKVVLGKSCFFVGAVLLFTSALSLLQKALYPSSQLFFLPDVLHIRLIGYAWRFYDPAEAILRGPRLLAYIFGFNFVAPELTVTLGPSHKVCAPDIFYVEFNEHAFHAFGAIAAALWLGLLAWGVFNFFRLRRQRTPTVTALFLWTLFNLFFFIMYGSGGLFIYSPSSTFAVLACVALSSREYYGAKGKIPKIYTVLAVAFLTFEALNNGQFFFNVMSIYKTSLLGMPR